MSKERKIVVNAYKKKLSIGDRVMVHAYKFNGWLYRIWHFPIVVDQINEWTILCSHNCNVISAEETSIRVFTSKIDKVNFWFMSQKRWFNIIVTIEKAGVKLYINMASPFIYEEGAIKYYDFDLDFKVFPNRTWTEIDINEYFENQVKYSYPPVLIDIINDAETQVKKLLEEGWFEQNFMDSKYLNSIYKKYWKLTESEREPEYNGHFKKNRTSRTK